MTRKRKIQFAAGFIFLVLIVWAFWPREQEGALTVTYAGVSTNDTDLVSFTITNRSQHPIMYFRYGELDTNGVFVSLGAGFTFQPAEIKARSAVTFDYRLFGDKPWRAVIVYSPLGAPSFFWRRRYKVAVFAYDHHWSSLGKWLRPKNFQVAAYGPVMQGNQPVVSASK